MNIPNHPLAGCVRRTFLMLASFALLTAAARAQVPAMISYQGRVLVDNTNYTGNGLFKFALVQGAGPTLLWKNDGSAGDTDPAAAVTLSVANGLVMTLLGDAPMTAIPASAFANSEVRLRVWFNGGPGFQQLIPDQRVVSVGYAMMAGNVPDGSITAAKLAAGVLSPGNFPANSVTSAQLADELDLGAAGINGRLDVYRTAAGTAAIVADADSQGGSFALYEEDGTLTAWIHNVSDAGIFSVRNSSGAETGYFWGRNSAGQTGGQLGLKNSSGVETITLNADAAGEGRIYTQVLTITGGSDLSENFNINETTAEPGMIVSIAPKSPGELLLSRDPYDSKVAGVVSGAGGVKPGMLMGQKGTKADGKHPVALTGRVYCWADASYGAIQPGDMITTSSTPGHGMKASDRDRAFGSIIGKAMTGLAEGKGLVLVLVSLQ